jgi:hypothetical protein
MENRDYLAEFSSVVASYLLTLSSVADCLGNTCPEVGGPYRDRLTRLRARLSFEATRNGIASATKTVEGELDDYAKAVARYQSQHEIELRSAIVLLQEIIDSMALRAEFQGGQLEKLAAEMEGAAAPAEHVERLRHCARTMTADALRTTAKMREEIRAVESRLEGSQSLDACTGLMNHREMARQIEAFRRTGCEFTLLRFKLEGVIGEPVLRQAAERLTASFRHRERIARWGPTQFMVLFQGPREIAERRAAEIAPRLERYSIEGGLRVEAAV